MPSDQGNKAYLSGVRNICIHLSLPDWDQLKLHIAEEYFKFILAGEIRDLNT
jgi:hypothetical protein